MLLPNFLLLYSFFFFPILFSFPSPYSSACSFYSLLLRLLIAVLCVLLAFFSFFCFFFFFLFFFASSFFSFIRPAKLAY